MNQETGTQIDGDTTAASVPPLPGPPLEIARPRFALLRRTATFAHLLFAGVLFLLPWINITCSGETVGTQSGLQACYGGISWRSSQENAETKEVYYGGSTYAILYGGLIGAGLLGSVICLACMLLHQPTLTAVTQLLALGCGTIACPILIVQLVLGFPLPVGFKADLAKRQQANLKKAKQDTSLFDPGGTEIRVVEQNVHFEYSIWLWLSLASTLVSAGLLLLEAWLLMRRFAGRGASAFG